MDYSREENHGMGLTPALPVAYNNNSNSSHAAPIIRVSPCPLIASTSPIARSGPITNGSAHEEPDNAPSATFKYRECLRNHAAATGGHVLDGCCEFMPSAADPLKCAACDCHRNFHRRQRDHQHGPSIPLLQLPPPPPHPAPARHPSTIAFCGGGSGSGATTESSGEERMGSGSLQKQQQQQMVSKKRFRTKFTAEQKGKMVEFAERVGWRMQRQEEAAVEDFCKQIGVRRHVLKVWMHNNKQHFIKQQQQQQHLPQQHLPQPQEQQSNNGLPIN